ncbi:protein kinase [Marinicella sp. W31]|uniref:protein kinase domain-containing protein n=1 Tax=Marinicella sp. W31 TaxID=3023713 RepID=UPI003757A706
MPDHDDLNNWFKAKEIFNDALAIDEDNQQSFVRTACAGDQALFDQIMELIDEHKTLENKTIDSASSALDHVIATPYLKQGDCIDKFKIIEYLSSGGVGEVYLAERNDAEVHQKVALKLIRSVFLSADALIRFQNEKRILASLEHPGIARLIDSGCAEDFSFYIMEYVEGVPIDVYCNKNRLSIEDRIKLLIQVCEVIGFAHNNLIVHRDLKPENILVNEEGLVKLLDFGIAKSMHNKVHSLTQTTATETLLTPQYAAPEQFDAGPPSVAADIYALGALAYLLLTQQSALHFDKRNWRHIERSIKHNIPVKPSTAVLKNSNAINPHDFGKHASVDIARLLQGDVDAIVLTCLKKEPINRYTNTFDLIKDLRCYLTHHPISVTHHHWLYRSTKFFKRHRSMSLMFTALILTLISALFLINQQKQSALHESKISKNVTDFLIQTFKAADPNQSMGADISVREILRTGIHQLQQQPLEDSLKSQLLLTFSEVLFHMAEFSQAQLLLNEIDEDFRNNSAQTLFLEARLLNAMEHYDLAQAAMLSLQDQLETDSALSVQLLQEQSRNLLSLDYPDRAREKALQSVQMSRQLYGEDSIEYALSLRSYGTVLNAKGELPNSAEQVQKALNLLQQHFQPPHLEIAYTQMRLAIILRRLQKYQQAYQLAESANQSLRIIYQDHHAVIASVENLLGTIKRRMDEPQQALIHYRNSIDILNTFFGEKSVKSASPLYNSALILWLDMQQPHQALEYFYKALKLIAKVKGENHLNYHYMQIRLSQCLIELNQFEEAKFRLDASLSFFENRSKNRGVNLAINRGALGQIAYFEGRLTDAVSLLQAALPVLKQHVESDHPTLRNGCLVWRRLLANPDLTEINDQNFCETAIQ